MCSTFCKCNICTTYDHFMNLNRQETWNVSLGTSTRDNNFDTFVDRPKETWENTDIWHTLNCTCETCHLAVSQPSLVHFEDRASLQSVLLIDSAHAHTCTQTHSHRVEYFLVVRTSSTVKTLYVSISSLWTCIILHHCLTFPSFWSRSVADQRLLAQPGCWHSTADGSHEAGGTSSGPVGIL